MDRNGGGKGSKALTSTTQRTTGSSLLRLVLTINRSEARPFCTIAFAGSDDTMHCIKCLGSIQPKLYTYTSPTHLMTAHRSALCWSSTLLIEAAGTIGTPKRPSLSPRIVEQKIAPFPRLWQLNIQNQRLTAANPNLPCPDLLGVKSRLIGTG